MIQSIVIDVANMVYGMQGALVQIDPSLSLRAISETNKHLLIDPWLQSGN